MTEEVLKRGDKTFRELWNHDEVLENDKEKSGEFSTISKW